MKPFPKTITEAMAIAAEFDRERHCRWNFSHVPRNPLPPDDVDYCATDFPETASLGDACWGDLMELALLTTLRPCKCGSDHLYKSNHQIACCECFGEDGCREETDCHQCAENMNLRDAITLWNLRFAADGPPGKVQVIG